jgi:DNA invertase Pin-like site-specific DNA recombinase
MTDPSKIKPSHTQRAAYVYIRQSTPGQVEHNRESTARQYALADRACQLGWAKEQVVIIDEDLGLSGSGTDKRSGFARLTSEVALAHVGIVLGLEVSRLARNNADWYRLLELCASPTHSSVTTTASIIPQCSTTDCFWASRAQ